MAIDVVLWFDEQDWQQWREILPSLQPSWEEWRARRPSIYSPRGGRR
jgi:hypothetical protein